MQAFTLLISRLQCLLLLRFASTASKPLSIRRTLNTILHALHHRSRVRPFIWLGGSANSCCRINICPSSLSLSLSVHTLTNHLNLADINAFASLRDVTLLMYGLIAQIRLEIRSRQSAVIPRNRTQILQNRSCAHQRALVAATNLCPRLLPKLRGL